MLTGFYKLHTHTQNCTLCSRFYYPGTLTQNYTSLSLFNIQVSSGALPRCHLLSTFLSNIMLTHCFPLYRCINIMFKLDFEVNLKENSIAFSVITLCVVLPCDESFVFDWDKFTFYSGIGREVSPILVTYVKLCC